MIVWIRKKNVLGIYFPKQTNGLSCSIPENDNSLLCCTSLKTVHHPVFLPLPLPLNLSQISINDTSQLFLITPYFSIVALVQSSIFPSWRILVASLLNNYFILFLFCKLLILPPLLFTISVISILYHMFSSPVLDFSIQYANYFKSL